MKVLVIGDSNLVRLESDIQCDEFIQQYDVTIDAKPGFRAVFLDGEWSAKTRRGGYTHVIVVCGNNDLSVHPRRKFERSTPVETALNLVAFHHVLRDNGIKCFVVGMLQRGDLMQEKHLVLETNEILKSYLMSNKDSSYIGPRHIQSKHFRQNDLAHLTEEGKFLMRAMLLKVLNSRLLVS